jgi:hypothetical protein
MSWKMAEDPQYVLSCVINPLSLLHHASLWLDIWNLKSLDFGSKIPMSFAQAAFEPDLSLLSR